MATMVQITKRSRERLREAYRLRCYGYSMKQIGEVMGVGVARASSMVKTGERISDKRPHRQAESQQP